MPTTLSFSFESIESIVMQEYTLWNQIQPLLEERGVIANLISAGGGYSYEIVATPEGLDFSTAKNEALIELGLKERHQGPWKFKVEINPQTH